MRILLTKSQIADKVQELGAQISEDYQDKNPILIGLLKGSVVFLADLMRTLTIPHTIDFIRASSYGAGMTSSGQVRVTSMDVDVENRHVLLIEDIIDSGVTLRYIKEVFLEKKPASLCVCALLDKPASRRTSEKVDYCGFTIPDVFVVGYGLDWNEQYRHLPYVAVVEEQENGP